MQTDSNYQEMLIIPGQFFPTHLNNKQTVFHLA